MDDFERDQIALAIREAWRTTDPTIRAAQISLTGSEDVPEVDELIRLLALKVRAKLSP